MEKKQRIFIISAIVLVIIIAVVAISYPPIYQAFTGGTIGKVKKFQKEQMSEKDLMLRSQIVSDSAALRSTIQSLMFFNLFAVDLTISLDTNIAQLKRSCYCEDRIAPTVAALEDYVKYIRNNNKTLQTTIAMLLDFYSKDTTDVSIDVEKNIREFDNYVRGFVQKDSIVDNLITSIDEYLESTGGHKGRKAEIQSLRKIKNTLIKENIQFAGVVGDQARVSRMTQVIIKDHESFSVVGDINAVTSVNAAAVNSQHVNAVDAVNSATTISSAGAISKSYVCSFNPVNCNFVFSTPKQAVSVNQAGQLEYVVSSAGSVQNVYVNAQDIVSSAGSINSQGAISAADQSLNNQFIHSISNGLNASSGNILNNVGTLCQQAVNGQSVIDAINPQ